MRNFRLFRSTSDQDFTMFPLRCTLFPMRQEASGSSPHNRNPEHERVGQTIQAFRERFGFTQDGLAIEVGMSRSHLANIEAGRKAISNRHLALIADALGIKPIAIKRFDPELVAA